MKNKNAKRFVALTSLAFAFGIIYLLPYMKSVFYDQMIAGTGFTNAQLGQLLSVYAMACTLSYLPGGWVADKVKPRLLITICLFLNGLLCFVFLMFHTNFTISMFVWIGAAFTGGFAFWPSVMKAVRLLGTKEEQGRLYGINEALVGVTSLLSSWLMVWVSTWFADLVAGFKGIVAVMGILCVIGALLVWFLYDENGTFDNEVLDSDDVIRLKDFAKVIVMPRVWVAALLLFGAITMYAGMGYLGPYSTEKFALAVGLASIIGSVREYGCRVGGIFGGFMADVVLKSSSKWQVVAHAITGILAFSFIFIPKSSTGLFIFVMLLFGFSVYANRVTVYSLLSELKVSPKVGGTAIALVTLIGYVPDMFVHTLFGTWIDNYGVDGYTRIFTYLGITGLVSVMIALVAFFMSKKINSAPNANNSAAIDS